ncbi:hypothetical protein V6N13_144739 [Hibiscus sabdariffa]
MILEEKEDMSTMNMIELENTCCLLDRDHGRDVEDHMQGERRGHIQDWDRDHELNFDQDRAPAGTNGYRTSVDEGKEQRLKRQNGGNVTSSLRSSCSSEYVDSINSSL